MRHTLRKRRSLRKRRILRKGRSLRKKRVTRKQSGGRIDMKKLELVINNRSNAALKADYSAKTAEEAKEHLESL
jgi:hypothetical protein